MSYNEKHNEANKEDNHDGSDNNSSWNCGAEGPTDDPEVAGLRRRQMHNFLATLLLSQGVPKSRAISAGHGCLACGARRAKRGRRSVPCLL